MDRKKVVEAYEEALRVQLDANAVGELLSGEPEAVRTLAQLPGYVIRAAATTVYGRTGGTLPLQPWAEEATRVADLRRTATSAPDRDSDRDTSNTASHVEREPGRHGAGSARTHDGWQAGLERWRKKPPPFRVLLDKIDECAAVGNVDAALQVAEIGANAYAEQKSGLLRIARRVVRAYLAYASGLDDLPEITARAKSHIGRHFATDGRRLPAEIAARLDEISVLLTDHTVYGRTQLSSLLRHVGRSDLAWQAVEPFDDSQASHVAALTSGAAALADLERLPEARGRAERAWSLEQNAATACLLSRISRLERNGSKALAWAQEAWQRERSHVTAHTLAGAAVLASDEDALAQASSWLGRHEEDDGEPSAYAAVRAGWILLRDGSAGEALEVADRILEQVPGYAPAERLRRSARRESPDRS